MRYFSKTILSGLMVAGLSVGAVASVGLESETAPNDNDIKSGPMNPVKSAVDEPGDNTAVDPATLPGNLEAKNFATDQSGRAGAGAAVDRHAGEPGQSEPPAKTEAKKH